MKQSSPGLFFRENKGQVGDQFSRPRTDVLFSGRCGDLTFHLRNNGISYQMRRVDSWRDEENSIFPKSFGTKAKRKIPDQTTIYRLDINWINAKTDFSLLKQEPLEGYDNFYSEVCPNGVTGVKSFKSVTYQNLYEGIDLKWYQNNGDLKYDYLVAPGVNYRQIQFEVKGAQNILVDETGDLVIKTSLGLLKEKSPVVTQSGKILRSKWALNKNIVSFEISGIDPSEPFVIDPLVRLWGTYYGGNSADALRSCEVDAAGNIYACGETDSQNNISTVGAYQTTDGGGPSNFSDDAILVKFNSAGVRLWSTYYGGNGGEYGHQCALDPTGNNIAMVGGTSTTLSGVMATPGSYQVNYAGNTSSWSGDVFVAVFNSSGFRQWATYYGGPGDDWGWGCDFDSQGNLYITGTTISTVGIASPGAYQTFWSGDRDGFLAKFTNSGNLIWSTYYGGEGWDFIDHCSCDPSDNVLIIGDTNSHNGIASPGALQPALSGLYSREDALIAKFNSSGIRMWGTYFGASGLDIAYNCDFDVGGNIFVAGLTNGAYPILSTTGAYQTTFGGGSYDAFLLKLNPAGSKLWCTYYGGSGLENNNWCCTDRSGNVYLVGCTTSTNTMTSLCPFQAIYAGADAAPPNPTIFPSWSPEGGDAYIAKFDSNGARLWGTYYGGTGYEGGNAYDINCAATTDALGNLYLVGVTSSTNGTAIANPGAYQFNYGGGISDGYLVKFDGCIPNAPNITIPSNQKVCFGDSTKLSTSITCGVSWYDVPFGGTVLGTNSVFTTPNLTTTSAYYVSDGSCGTDSIRTTITVTVNPLPVISIEAPNNLLCYSSDVTVKASGAISYTWNPDKWINCTNCADPILSPLQTMSYCVEGADVNNCVGSSCITIEVNWARDHNFSLPNAFTPNGDNNNDSFCLQGWDICNDEFLVRIFDRWGEKVFESKDPNFCWDGIYEGKILNADVYVYSVSAKYKDGTKVNKKGNISLIK